MLSDKPPKKLTASIFLLLFIYCKNAPMHLHRYLYNGWVISYSTSTTHLTNTKNTTASQKKKKTSVHASSITATSAPSDSHGSSPTASHVRGEVTSTSNLSMPTHTFLSRHCPDSCDPFTSLALRVVDSQEDIYASKNRIHAVQLQCYCDCSHYK